MLLYSFACSYIKNKIKKKKKIQAKQTKKMPKKKVKMKKLRINLYLPVKKHPRDLFYSWPWLEKKISRPGKGYGIFATGSLPIGTAFPYFGQLLTLKEWKQLNAESWEKEKKIGFRVNYFASAGKDKVLDACPVLDHLNAFKCAYINEPSEDEQSNCTLYYIRKAKCSAVVVIKEILPNEELLLDYGNSYTRNYKTGKMTRKPSYLAQLFVTPTSQQEIELENIMEDIQISINPLE
jgi:hypothetical protein